MGLYDNPVGALDPRSMALMQAGLGMMSGPSMTPVSLGQQLGRAGQIGMNAFQQTQQANQQNQLFAMKMAEVKRQEDERVKKEAAMAQLLKDPRFANMGPLLQVAPQQAIERAFPKDNRPVVVSPGGSLVDPEKPEKPLFTAPVKPESPSGLAQMIKERDALPSGSPLRATYDAAIKKSSTHSPLVQVDTRQESEFNKAVGKELGGQYSDLMKSDFAAPATIGKYQRLGSLLGQVNTGKFKGTTTELKAAAKSLGFDLNSMGVGDDVAPAQAARALSNQLALELRNPAGGAGMPGALSDKDREFLVQSLPTLESDPGAVGKMIEYRVKLAQREQKVARMARDYRKKNGKFDEGFFDELQDWSEKNPMFSGEKGATPAAKVRRYNPETGKIE
jgi:hypothetical protein